MTTLQGVSYWIAPGDKAVAVGEPCCVGCWPTLAREGWRFVARFTELAGSSERGVVRCRRCDREVWPPRKRRVGA